MSLNRVIAAPFLRRETDTVTRAEFIYSLTADLGWFEPEGAEEALEVGLSEELLHKCDRNGLRIRFDAEGIEIPEGWSPDDPFFTDNRGGEDRKEVFERVIDRLVSTGYGKREAVAEVNKRHTQMGDVNIEAAALLLAKEEGLRVADLAQEALDELKE